MPNTENFCFLFIQHWSTCLQKNEWAAWAQAALSALAILASVLIVNRQHRKQLDSIRYEHDLQSQRETERLTEARLAWLTAVEHKIKSCSRQCEIYVVQFFESALASPKYRLSMLAHDTALASLLADGTLTESATDAIKQFYTDADSFNRGLDKLEELWIRAVLTGRRQIHLASQFRVKRIARRSRRCICWEEIQNSARLRQLTIRLSCRASNLH